MPQFYARDNLECWFTTCFTEHYESLDEPDAKTFAFEVLEESEHLDKAEEFLLQSNLVKSNLVNDTMVDAILHSVDWGEVIERFKKAIDYNENNIDCGVCGETFATEQLDEFREHYDACHCKAADYEEEEEEEEEAETCVNCDKTKIEVWSYNTTSTKNAPVCYDCLQSKNNAIIKEGVPRSWANGPICSMGPHYCDEALNGKKCPHELCDIDDCRKHGEEYNTIILKNKGLTKCDECGGINNKTCQCQGSIKM